MDVHLLLEAGVGRHQAGQAMEVEDVLQSGVVFFIDVGQVVAQFSLWRSCGSARSVCA